ncbi:MAG: hypothetical protein KDI82_09855 [Gammaproteobacteria bacterium]|nr:hypothetical protein [Gammaproteobacteria bacterium]
MAELDHHFARITVCPDRCCRNGQCGGYGEANEVLAHMLNLLTLCLNSVAIAVTKDDANVCTATLVPTTWRSRYILVFIRQHREAGKPVRDLYGWNPTQAGIAGVRQSTQLGEVPLSLDMGLDQRDIAKQPTRSVDADVKGIEGCRRFYNRHPDHRAAQGAA